MRSTSYSRGTQSVSQIPWNWVGGVGAILLILILVRVFGSTAEESTERYLTVTPSEQSSVYISMTSASKSRISGEEKLYATDKSVSVEAGSATAKNEYLSVDLDKGSELSYKASTLTGNSVSVGKGRVWITDITAPLEVGLKNYSVHASPGATLLVEQNALYSNMYAVEGSMKIQTSIGEKDIPAGSMISLLKSDLVNPATELSDWIQPISGAILEHPLFMRNDGQSLLKNISLTTSSGETHTGTTQSGSLALSSSTTSFIEVTDPKINTVIRGKTLTVMGNLLSKDVKKVTINNVEATVSPVNESFVAQDIIVTSEVFDIVYKAYDANNTLLQVGVMSVFGSKNILDANSSLIPETFPVSAKDFKITSPSGNPYSTTDRFIKVQGTIPKNTVDYIVVNDYRLQKFVAKSGSWYYFANMDTGTMKDGLNLYNIKFYSADNTLLYSQPFTIIKESKNATISGE